MCAVLMCAVLAAVMPSCAISSKAPGSVETATSSAIDTDQAFETSGPFTGNVAGTIQASPPESRYFASLMLHQDSPLAQHFIGTDLSTVWSGYVAQAESQCGVTNAPSFQKARAAFSYDNASPDLDFRQTWGLGVTATVHADEFNSWTGRSTLVDLLSPDDDCLVQLRRATYPIDDALIESYTQIAGSGGTGQFNLASAHRDWDPADLDDWRSCMSSQGYGDDQKMALNGPGVDDLSVRHRLDREVKLAVADWKCSDKARLAARNNAWAAERQVLAPPPG